MKFVLVWLVIAIAPTGEPVTGEIKDATTFDSIEQCQQFGAEHADRMGDWLRGLLRADWETPVKAQPDCRADGQPANRR